MYIFPCRRIRYIKTITINTHIDCSKNSKCSVRHSLGNQTRSLLKCLLQHFLLELQEKTNKRRMTAFDDAVKEYLQDYNHVLKEGGKSESYDWSTHPFEDDPDFKEEFDDTVNKLEVKEADELFTPDTYDRYLQMKLALPQGDSLEPRLSKVTKQLKDANGIPIGTANQNPLLDTQMYEVEFAGGEKASIAANSIAENVFAQIDVVGN